MSKKEPPVKPPEEVEATPPNAQGERDGAPVRQPHPNSDDANKETSSEQPTIVFTHHHRFRRWCLAHKKSVVVAVLVVTLAILAAVPHTRYMIAGTFWKQEFSVLVLDRQTNTPVSSADVQIGGAKIQTDAQGKASLKAKVGKQNVVIEKRYYTSEKSVMLVPILKQKNIPTVHIIATGRQVPVTVLNRITKKPLANAQLAAADTKAKTDENGKTILVLPADKQAVEATISANGYTSLTAKIAVTTDEQANVALLVPEGSVFFLSNASGKVDVVKAALDGTSRQTVLAGTGREDKNNTTLLASRDWKYLALLSKRDGGEHAKVFLIDTSTGQSTVMDEGIADFSLVGWSDYRFVYTVNRANVQAWEQHKVALKTYDARSHKLTVLDQMGGEGDAANYVFADVGQAFIQKDEIVYLKNWNSNYTSQAIAQLQSKKTELRSIRPDGTGGRLVQSYSVRPGFGAIVVDAKLYEPNGIWIKATNDVTEEYEDSQIKTIANVSYEQFYSSTYVTHLISPSGNATFWSEPRDGKYTLFVGNKDAQESKQVGALSEYQSYGWYTDDYLLVSKRSSELYILPVAGGEPMKISDYFKPASKFDGYGYGYGGL